MLDTENLVTVVLGAAGTALAALWKASESKNSKAIAALELRVQSGEEKLAISEKRHDECQEDRTNLRLAQIELTVALESLRGKS